MRYGFFCVNRVLVELVCTSLGLCMYEPLHCMPSACSLVRDSSAHMSGDNITTENISAFIEEYDEEKLERKELQEEDEEEDGAGQ
jgi:hypothetical protein